MNRLPQHKAALLSDCGVFLRRIVPPDPHIPSPTYAHQDDYYIIGLVENGTGRAVIDFEEHDLGLGDLFLIQPGQVHNLVGSNVTKGWTIMVDSSLVEPAERRVFDDFALFASAFRIDEARKRELEQMAYLQADRMARGTDEPARRVVRKLAEALVAVVAEALQHLALQPARCSRRQVEIVSAFRRLLAEDRSRNRQPSHYVALLHLSPVYLNEVIKRSPT